ncbi:MAG: pre-peptidase C-terminal domain-containing protein [Pseudomonadota bacterium]
MKRGELDHAVKQAGFLDAFVDKDGAFDFAPNALQDFTGPVTEAVVINPPTEVPGNTATTYALNLGDTAVSSVDVAGDDDWYRVQLVAGQSYAFTMVGSGGAALEDPYLELHDSAGQLISLDDDGGPGRTSLLRFTATSSGTYYINARAWEPDTGATLTGGYTLAFNSGPPQNPLDTIDLGFVVPTHAISVYFAQTGETYDGETAMRSWNANEITAAFNALATYEAIADLHFVQTNDPGSATFILTLADLPDNVLGQMGTTGGIGYGTFDPTATGWTTGGLLPGGLGFVTLIHEFGHGLGLAHPHDSGGTSETMQGVIDLFDSYGTYLLNQGVFTTMTYNDGWPAGPMGQTFSTTYGDQATPMALDVALIQLKYGVNPTTNSGDTVYTLGDTNGPGATYRAIWDTGGNDTIAYSGSFSVVIDLRGATLQSEIGGGGFVSYVAGIHSGYTIANGVVIENAQAGFGFDTLTGNDASNQLSGGGGNDTLDGYNGDDVLIGGAGYDTIDGGPGADAMWGGSEGDVFYIDNVGDTIGDPDEGDTIFSTVGFTLPEPISVFHLLGNNAADIVGNSVNNAIDGNEGANAISGLNGGDILHGNGENDTLSGGDGDDNLSGDVGNDIIFGDAGVDFINGGIGNDTLDGGAGVDTMYGGAGDDTFFVDNAADVVGEFSGEGVDTIFASANFTLDHDLENLTLLAGAANGVGNTLDNRLIGNGSANALSGLEGADTLDGGAGADTMSGGVGNDTFYVDNSGDVVTESGSSNGIDTIRSTVGIAALATNVENLELLGGVVTGNGNELNNRITGNSSNNFLNGMAGADTLLGGLGDDSYFIDNASDVVTEAGGAGTDTIFSTINIISLFQNVENLSLNGAAAITATGNALNNVINGNSTNNTLNGGVGEDTLNGALGNDTYVVNSAGDVVNDTGGNADTILSFIDMATLAANIENLTLAGSALIGGGNELNNVVVGDNLNNTLSGGLGNDQLNGATGADIMSGGQGDDSYLVENAGDVVVENSGEGADTVYAFVTLTSLAANVEKLTLMPGGGAIDGTANDLDNRLNGNDFDNVLTALGGNDVIQGLGGNDHIIGGAGLDNIFGGAGNDTFVYQALADSGVTGGARDLINDFLQGQDVIDLSAIDAIAGGADDAFTLIGASAFTHTAGQLRFDQIDGVGFANDFTIIGLDVNGDGVADSQIGLRGLITLTAVDFVL